MRGRVVLYFIMILMVYYNSLLARTREDVINEAISYKNYFWHCSENNILDVVNHKDNINIYPAPSGQDGYDDRGWRWDIEKGSWVYSTEYWPYYIGWSGSGEAYGWGLWDKTEEFGIKLSGGYIAGKRSNDPSEYNYTGIDCSGLVSRVLGLRDKYGTEGLKSICISISPKELKKGDLLFCSRSGVGHVVIFGDDKFGGDSGFMNVYHSVSWSYGVSKCVYRTVEENNVEYRMENGNLYLRDKSKSGDSWDEEKVLHQPYTPFPKIIFNQKF